MAYNNAYVEGSWGLFRNVGAMRLITRKASLAGVDIPASLVDPHCKACPAFHIKEMCNTRFGNAADHVAHTQEQDLPLWGWAVRSMPEIAAPLAPVTYAPCANHKPRPVRENARTHHPLYRNTAHQQEANITAEEDRGTGCQATGSYSSAAASSAAIQHR